MVFAKYFYALCLAEPKKFFCRLGNFFRLFLLTWISAWGRIYSYVNISDTLMVFATWKWEVMAEAIGGEKTTESRFDNTSVHVKGWNIIALRSRLSEVRYGVILSVMTSTALICRINCGLVILGWIKGVSVNSMF